MNEHDAERLLSELGRLYVRGGDIEPREEKVWISELKKLDYKQASAVINRLYLIHPPAKSYGQLPTLPDFKAIYYEKTPRDIKRCPWCPCCNGTGFIILEDANRDEVAHRCHCRTGKLQSERDCQNPNCQNQARSDKLTVLAGYSEKFPWAIVGYRHCRYTPAITEVKNLGIPPTDIAIRLLFRCKVPVDRYVMDREKWEKQSKDF